VNTAVETVATRAAGEQPSRMRSLFTAVVVGGATAVMTYRLLRHQHGRDGE
jgi:hypothetical protein